MKKVRVIILSITLIILAIVFLLAVRLKPFSTVNDPVALLPCKEYKLASLPEVTDKCITSNPTITGLYKFNGFPITSKPTDCNLVMGDVNICPLVSENCTGFIPVAKVNGIPYYYLNNNSNFCNTN